MTLQKIHELVAKWLVFNDPLLIDVILMTMLANRLKGDPLWLMLIGPPSTGKTEVIDILRLLPDAHFLSDLTPRTFFSGWKGSGGEDCSLLPKIDGKTLALKDFTTVLSFPQEKRAEILGQLREIFDGNFSKQFGNSTTAHIFSGKVGFIAGVTPAIDLHHRANAILGERFIYLRHDLDTDALREQSARRAITTNTSHKQLQLAAQTAVVQYMSGLPKTDPTISQETEDALVDLADAVAWGRCPVARDGYSRTILQAPRPEGPGRVVKQLATVARAHAALLSHKIVMQDDLAVVKRVARDTIPPLRAHILRTFGEHPESDVKTLSVNMRLPYSTIREHIEDARAVGLIENGKEIDQIKLSTRGMMILNCMKNSALSPLKKRKKK